MHSSKQTTCGARASSYTKLFCVSKNIDVAAQNCLFNIFKAEDLKKAIEEMYRVLKPHGKLVMSDPTCEQPMNDELRNDDRLRALCLSGSLPIAEYVKALTDAGFGTIEIRARKPYRILDTKNYPTEELIYIESIEVAAIKDPMPSDGPCIFTGKAAIYYGDGDYFGYNGGSIRKNSRLPNHSNSRRSRRRRPSKNRRKRLIRH